MDVSGGSTFHIETNYLAGFSHIVKTSPRGKRSVVSRDFLAHETRTNPDGRVTEGFVGLKGQCASDLAALEAQIGQRLVSEYRGEDFCHAYQLDVTRHATYVADAGANALLKVSPRSAKISTVAVLPPVKVTTGAELLDALNAMLAGIPELPEDTTAPDCLLGKTFVAEPVPTDVEMLGGEVSVIPKGSRKSTTLFAADSPGDVEVHGNTVYATTGVFDPEGNGTVVKVDYRHRGRR
ncbi:hypothetical protein [Citricoccus nitrophenolicus]|uniref:hypothetical protein n=1 Tax=Citricoccus nitrophenolicus TaxID=863575 RepID=UPI0031EE5B15